MIKRCSSPICWTLCCPSVSRFSVPQMDRFIPAATGSTVNFPVLIREATFWLLPNESLLFTAWFCQTVMASQGLFTCACAWFRLVPLTAIFGLSCSLEGRQFWIEIASLGANFLTLCSPYTCKVPPPPKKNPTFQFRREFAKYQQERTQICTIICSSLTF